MCREHGPELVQSVNPDLGRASGHRRTQRGIAHPRRKLARQSGTNLDIEDLLAAAPCPLVQAQSLAAQRMPPVLNDNKLRSVC